MNSESLLPNDVVALFDVLPDAVIVSDEAGRIVQLNREAEQLFGYAQHELIGQTIETLLPEALRDRHMDFRAHYLQNPRPCFMGDRSREFQIQNRTGEHLYVEVSLTPIESPEGRLIVSLLRNVTERVSSQRTLMKIGRRTFAKTHQDFLISLAHALAEELEAHYITVGRVRGDKVETVAFLKQGKLAENITYALAGTPCDTTVKEAHCVVTDGLQERYPEDELLAAMGMHAYVGVRLYSSRGEAFGLINVLYGHPISQRVAELTLSLLEIIALRASPELERVEVENLVRKLSLSVDLSPIAVMITDSKGVIEYVNPKFCEMSGYSQEQCLGRTPSINASGKTPEKIYQVMWECILAGREWSGEFLNRRQDGSLYWAHTRIFPMLDAGGAISNFVSIQEDVSRARQLTRRLEYEATHDQLTDLINRREFERRLEQALGNAKESGGVHCICFLDLDQFKVLNDSSGHIAGDTLLKMIGQILKREVRMNDTAARLGGDEFGLLLMNCPRGKAVEIAEKIREGIASLKFSWDSKVHAVGASIGITEISGAVPDTVELMKQVDAACYSAKEQGRNRIHVYREDSEPIYRHLREMDWVSHIHTALSENRFELFVQPIVPVKWRGPSPPPLSYEVLIRLLDKQDKLVVPAQFLPVVERYKLSTRLDRHVVDMVFSWLARNPQAMEEVQYLAVNLTAASIADRELLDHLLGMLREGGVPPGKIRFELTEAAAISNLLEARHFMSSIRQAGSQIVLDDFGSGLSSFSYLRSLPVDMLKIDGLLVKGVASDEPGFIMVKMINELAHSLGIKTVAEYVENEAILSCLEELGVDFAQGHAIDFPAQIDDVFGSLGKVS